MTAPNQSPSAASLGPIPVLILAIALLCVIGAFDHVTTFELSLGVFYFLPVAFAAWKGNRTIGLLVACLSTGVWFGVETYAGLEYSSPWFSLWNGAARAISFVAIAMLVSALCDNVKRQRAANDQLSESIAESERAALRIKELQGELQLVCSWTNRIQSEGRWMTLEEFMHRNFKLSFTHGISEEAAQRMNADITAALKDADETSNANG
jgi:hypothetical protein